MTEDERLDDLLDDWVSEHERGTDVTVGVLCREEPDLAPALENYISRWKATEWMFATSKLDDREEEFLSLPGIPHDLVIAQETILPSSDVTADEFLKRVSDAGLLTKSQLSANLTTDSASARDVARELIRERKLTNYQVAILSEKSGTPLRLGEYVILEKLGAGGMGQVFLARHRRMKRIVALKILPQDRLDNPDAVSRFGREVEAAAKLSHPNIVTAHDAGEENGDHYLISEYVAGGDLTKLVKASGPFPPRDAVEAILQTARGLEYAHAAGVIHRDIKPSNLLQDQKGNVKILDMGLARFEDSLDTDEKPSHMAPAEEELTTTGTVMGTVDFMSPEQAIDTHTADAKSDIYSLGCTLFYLMTGRAPYSGNSVVERIIAHRESPIPSLLGIPTSRNREETETASIAEIDAVFCKMIAKNPQQRYQSATEVVAALEAIHIPDDVPPLSSIHIHNTTGPVASTLFSTRDHTASGQVRTMETDSVSPVRVHRTRLYYAAGSAILVAVTMAVLYFAGVIFKVKTPDGTLIIEVDDPKNVVVEIDGQTVKVKPTADGKAIEIRIEPGTRKLVVKTANGIVLKTDGKEKLEIAAGKTQRIKAWIEQASGGREPAGKRRRTSKPAYTKFVAAVAKLKPEKQIAAVRARLKLLNPGFDGKLEHRVENGRVVYLAFLADRVTDISPVRALPGLELLSCGGSEGGQGRLADLSPLQGMKLTGLYCHDLRVADLSPLRGMPLTYLSCKNTQVTDLAPLKGMKLTVLYCNHTRVSDLSPLKGMPLTRLNSAGTQVSDLSPLKGMKLRNLDCDASIARKNGPLLKAMKTLLSINGQPAAAFWKKDVNAKPSTNYALKFDGKDDYVEFPISKNWPNGPMTFEAFVVLDKASPELATVVNAAGFKLRIFMAGPQWMFIVYGPGKRTLLAATPGRWKPGIRTHVAGVYDGKTVQLYVNGQLNTRILVPRKFRVRSEFKTGLLGATNGMDAKSFFRGIIDEVRISKTARYTHNFTPAKRFKTDKETLALYHCDDRQGSKLIDSSGNNNHGTIHGATRTKEVGSAK